MKILINTISAQSGGGLTYLVNVGRELARDPRGNEYRFLVSSERASELREIESDACRVESIRIRNVAHRICWEQTALPSLSRDFDLLFCAADLAPLWKPVPTLVSLRNLNIYDHTYYPTARLRFFRWIAGLGLRSIDRALFPSKAAAATIGDIVGLPPAKGSVIHYGIDPVRFERFEPEQTDPAVPAYVLIPAAVERHKNFEVVVDAIPHLAHSDLEFWIAGSEVSDPTYVDAIRDRAKRFGVESRIRFLGAVGYAQIPDLYARAAAALLPSFIETFGHPLLEAMICRTPLVVSDIPVFREIAGDDAWYFPARDGAVLASVLDTILENGEAVERRRQSGHARALRHSWSAYVDRLCEEFELTIYSRS